MGVLSSSASLKCGCLPVLHTHPQTPPCSSRLQALPGSGPTCVLSGDSFPSCSGDSVSQPPIFTPLWVVLTGEQKGERCEEGRGIWPLACARANRKLLEAGMLEKQEPFWRAGEKNSTCVCVCARACARAEGRLIKSHSRCPHK